MRWSLGWHSDLHTVGGVAAHIITDEVSSFVFAKRKMWTKGLLGMVGQTRRREPLTTFFCQQGLKKGIIPMPPVVVDDRRKRTVPRQWQMVIDFRDGVWLCCRTRPYWRVDITCPFVAFCTGNHLRRRAPGFRGKAVTDTGTMPAFPSGAVRNGAAGGNFDCFDAAACTGCGLLGRQFGKP